MEPEGRTIFGVEWRRVVQVLLTGIIAMYFLLFYSGACVFLYLLLTRDY